MKRRAIFGLISVATALSVFASLVPAGQEKPAPATAVEKPRTETERLAKGKDLIDSICFWCHEPELIETKQLDKKQWAALIRGMIYEGAPVTEDEFELIVEYLAKNFGPEPEQGAGEQKQ
jgi:cytochrome c5